MTAAVCPDFFAYSRRLVSDCGPADTYMNTGSTTWVGRRVKSWNAASLSKMQHTCRYKQTESYEPTETDSHVNQPPRLPRLIWPARNPKLHHPSVPSRLKFLHR